MSIQTMLYRYDEYDVKEWTTTFKVLTAFTILHAYALLSAVGIYLVESTAELGNIQQYSDAVWVVYMAATTIGFGDVYPVTTTGKMLVMLSFYIGVGLTSFIGVTVASKLTGFTDTSVKNRELRHLLKESIERDKVNEDLNKKIYNHLMKKEWDK